MNPLIQTKRRQLGTLAISLSIGIASGVWFAANAADVQSAKQTRVDDSAPAPGLHVWFKLERPGGSNYRKPYVAVWLEDTDGFPVKTAVLWWQTEQPGPRWHRDLTRWYRNNRM